MIDGAPVSAVHACDRRSLHRLVSTSVFAFLLTLNEYTLALIVPSRFGSDFASLWLQSFQQGLQHWTGAV